MSYTIRIAKDSKGIWILGLNEAGLRHIPNGEFVISGHQNPPGTKGMDFLGIALISPDSPFGVTISASHPVGSDVPPSATAE